MFIVCCHMEILLPVLASLHALVCHLLEQPSSMLCCQNAFFLMLALWSSKKAIGTWPSDPPFLHLFNFLDRATNRDGYELPPGSAPFCLWTPVAGRQWWETNISTSAACELHRGSWWDPMGDQMWSPRMIQQCSYVLWRNLPIQKLFNARTDDVFPWKP